MKRKITNKVASLLLVVGAMTVSMAGEVQQVYADSSSGDGNSGSHTSTGNWYSNFDGDNVGWRISVVDPDTGKMLSAEYADIV